jgi:hypothetical protein
MWLASLAHAAGLDGTWVFQGPNGELIARIEVKGSALAGSIEIDGVLNLTISQEEGPNQRAASLPLQFQRMKPGQAEKPVPSAPGSGGDPRLVGIRIRI